MPQTPLSTDTPYCTAQELFVYHDNDQIADMLRTGNAPRPSVAAMQDANTVPGAMVFSFLMAGAGRIESVCLIGKRYTPADLQALTGASRRMLAKLNADVSFWQLCQRRQPGTSDPRNVPGAMEAFELLKSLRDGEAIFGLQETAEAGLPTVVQAQPDALLTPNAVRKALRLFVNTYPNTLLGGGS